MDGTGKGRKLYQNQVMATHPTTTDEEVIIEWKAAMDEGGGGEDAFHFHLIALSLSLSLSLSLVLSRSYSLYLTSCT
jgi:hypothetical protein